MHYLLFGKFQPQSKLLDPNIKVHLIDRNALINIYAKKYKFHKLKDTTYKYDVFFLEKAKLYRLDNQYESNGDLIMIDPNEDRNYNYYETEIHNKSLSQIYNDLKVNNKDNNIVIHLFSNI
jgi:hypothetical protein